jgi:protease-4
MRKFFGRFFAFIGVLVCIPLFIGILMAIFHMHWSPSVPKQGVIALDLSKPYSEGSSNNPFQSFLGNESLSFLDLLKALEEAAYDERIKGIVLNVDEVTMGLAQMEELREALQLFRDQGKFIYAYANTFGDLSSATKAYYIASSADQIWMQPYSSVNLTGLYVAQPFLRKFLTNFGVVPQIETRKEYKNAFSFLTDDKFSDASREATTGILTEVYKTLIETIAADRELKIEMVYALTKNEPMMSDSRAKEIGLIDHLGYVDQFKDATLQLAGENAEFVSVENYYEGATSWENTRGDSHIAVIKCVGAIEQHEFSQESFLSDSFIVGAEETRAHFEEALKDPKTKAIILRIDSPGGSAVASETIRRSILLAQSKRVPVIASLSNTAASGGYWFAVPCKKIVSNAMTLTGSIGTIAGKIVFKGALNKYDVFVDSIAVGENGSLWSMYAEYTPEQKKFLDQTLDTLYSRFIQIVAEGRKLPLDHIKEIAKGRVWTGRQAHAFGLVDVIGGFYDALDLAKEQAGIPERDEVAVIFYPLHESTLERLKQSFTHHGWILGTWRQLTSLLQSIRLILSQKVQLIDPQVEHINRGL